MANDLRQDNNNKSEQMKVEESSFDMLPHLTTDFDRDSSLGFATDCPSLSSSFFSSDSSMGDCQGTRRASLASCSSTASPETLFTPSVRTTSPITPMTADPGIHVSCKQFMKTASFLTSCHPVFQMQAEYQDAQSCGWMANTDSVESLSMLTGMPDMLMVDGSHSMYHPEIHGLSHANSNPALTKPIFGGSSVAAMTAVDNALFAWNSVPIHPPVETIEPSVAFQHILPSSPDYKLEPSTPLNAKVSSSAILSSSPLSIASPLVLLSQHDVEELPYGSLEKSLRLAECKAHRPHTDRLSRRGYERKRLSGASSKPKISSTKSGIDCDLVITQNEFACSYPGCIDKHTGKQKRFKRQEHKKRHEKTVHEKENHAAYKCWVPECKRPFSRTDNLKSHLRNTHSKRPGVRGNRYVATLDKSSEYYDPEWVGELDKNGYPLL